MKNVLIKIVDVLKNDATLTAIVPSTQIFVGPVDVVTEVQAELLLPQINIHQVSESSRSVPLNVRDTIIQLDIWSRNSQLEVEDIYERIITLLNYLSVDQGVNHIFWEKLSGATDLYESDRRIWHRA